MSKDSQELMMETQQAAERSEASLAAIPQSKINHQESRILLAGLSTAALLWLCYFPLACGWLAWIALVPLLCLVRTAAPAWRVYLGAWAAGLAFFAAALEWMRVADYRMYYTWIALAFYCSFYLPVSIYFLRRFDRLARMPMVVTVPVVWTALEFARAHLLGGFAWYFLGHTQHDFLPAVQIADLAGAYAVTFLVAAVNALVFELLCTQVWFRTLFALPPQACRLGRYSLLTQGAAVVLLFGAALAYGTWRLGQDKFTSGPRIALVQTNVDQRLRNEAATPEAGSEAVASMSEQYRKLGTRAASQHADLVVWPETSYPYPWLEVSPDLPSAHVPAEWREDVALSQRAAREDARRWSTYLLLGVNGSRLEADGQIRRSNSAVLIHPDGQVGDRYDKIHCVPFGEYVPLRDWLPWLNAFAPYDFDYSITPGSKRTCFSFNKYHFGVVICYEDTDPSLARAYVDPEAGGAVDFLVNISNDGWFDGTREHEEHLAICRFRAIECRRAVVRAVNMGISAVIDGNGRVVALPAATWAQSKKTEAVVTTTVPLDRRVSLYARWGDWLPWTCWLVVAGCLAWTVVWPLRSASVMVA